MIFTRTPRAVIFDMDGLLFDTERLYLDALTSAARGQGAEAPADLFVKSIGLSSEETMTHLDSHFGGRVDLTLLWTSATEHFFKLADTQLQLKPGAAEILDLLDRLEIPYAIATSSKPENADHHLAAHGLTGRFRAIAAKGSYAHSKPHPDPFLTAAAMIGAEPWGCVALEDSHNGVRSASAAGMMTIMVPDLLEANEEMRGLCAHVAADLHEVAGLIEAAVRGR